MNANRRIDPARRRGALLLLVLTALTFFMMIGTLMLIIATRTRTTSRAFADATNAKAASSLQSRAILDEALLVLLRGKRPSDEARLPVRTTGTAGAGPTVTMKGQSLLEDKYGTEKITGRATPPVRMSLGLYSNYAPILTTDISNLTVLPAQTLHPCDLNGRILTFKPDPGDGDVASYRILRTTKQGQTYTAYLANTAVNRSPVLPKNQCDVIINGREFCRMPEVEAATGTPENNEPHDAYASDPWLAGIPLEKSKPITDGTMHASFAGPTEIAALSRDANGDGLADGCDNDNDGVADSWWISGLVPDRPSPLGGVLRHDLAFLVLDLDGRINVNATGSLTPVVTSTTDWPTTFVTSTLSGVPVGLGYGPADVAAGRLVATGTHGPGIPGFPGRWPQVCQSNTSATPNQTAATPTQRRPTPFVGAAVEGRYGPSGTNGRWTPGKAGSTVDIQSAYALAGQSPTDLNTRFKAFLGPSSSGVPTLYYFTPTYDFTVNDTTNAADMKESPYQLRLDVDGPRTVRMRQATLKSGTTPTAAARATDNVFAVAELERVLRQFDPDAGTLPPRLASLLDDFTERSRMTITTDSWDTPALAGAAMLKVRDYLRQFQSPSSPVASLGGANAADVYDVMSHDVAAGLRFDLNRPLDHAVIGQQLNATRAAATRAKVKERYCRHLYALLVALGMPASKETAQWAANACDFRDGDSTMTRFRYDTNPLDGWGKTGLPSVFGAERPDVVITETLAWYDGTNGSLSVALYHPWDARIVDKRTPSDSTKYQQTELPDPALAATQGNNPANAVDLGRKVGNDSIWRLRVVGGSTVDFASLNSGGGSSKLRLDPNTYLCVQSASGGGGGLNSITVSTFLPTGPGLGKVVLERLADPTKPYSTNENTDDYNPYVTVDEAALQVGADAATAKKQQRTQATFWKQAWSDATGAPATYPTKAPWFHWPNRPFVSVAELALVPAGDASTMLQVGATSASPVLDTADAARKLILDAVHVPSRFAGTAQPIGAQSGANATVLTSATNEAVCTTMLPRWREPGRINVNTIARNTGNGQPQLDNGVWAALLGSAAAGVNGGANPFTKGGDDDDKTPAAADSFAKMLSLSANGGAVYVDTPAAPRDSNPFFAYATAIRLANTGTIRSNVFAVWITLRVTDTSASAPSPVYKRMFAIIDRSIPVGFSKGENLDVRDAIRLQRFLD